MNLKTKKENKMLKNVIGFTSQEREELNDKKDFLKKMIIRKLR